MTSTYLWAAVLRGRRGRELAGLEEVQQGRLAGEVEAEKEDAAALVVQTEQVQEPREDPAEQREHLTFRISSSCWT